MPPEDTTDPAADAAADAQNALKAQEQRRLAQETRDERKMWGFLAYFLFGIHFIAFVMIYAVRHAK